MKMSNRYFRIYTWVSLIAVLAMLVSACAPQAAEPSSLGALVAVGQTATAVAGQAESAAANVSSNSIAAESNTVISGNTDAGSAGAAAPAEAIAQTPLPPNVQPQAVNSILPAGPSVVSADTPSVSVDDTPVVSDDDTSVASDDSALVVSNEDTSVVSDAQVLPTDAPPTTLIVQASTVNTAAIAPQVSSVQVSGLSNTALDAIVVSPAAGPTQISQLAWFYKPPADKNLDTLAANFDAFILTHKDEATRDALRTKGMTAPVLQYLRFDAIHDPRSCTTVPSGNQAAYKPGDFCDISANHNDWFLLDAGGKRIQFLSHDRVYYRMNPDSSGWREFFVARANEMRTTFGWDGLFMDSVVNKTSITQADVEEFFAYVRANYSAPVVANIGGMKNEFNGAYDQYLDGVMHEAWLFGWDSKYLPESTWLTHLSHAEALQAAGKYAFLVARGKKDDLQRQQFAYGSYLLVANGLASFRYSNGAYGEVWLYPNYQVDMGAPLGKRYKAGSVWQRDFVNGTVIVDPVTHKVTFKMKKQIPTLTATPTKAITKTATYTATPVPPSATPAFTATSLPTSTPVPPTETTASPTATLAPPTVVPTTDPGATPAPVAGQLCPTWVHDRNTTVAPDGLTYPTWHPQVDPEFGCYFDHEHGADPRTSLADPSLPAFGYINAFADTSHIAHEPHNGFKVFVVNKGTTNDEGRTATTSTRIVAHMGTGGPARFDNQFHSLEFDLVADDGHYVHVQGMADTGGVGSICDSPRQGKTVMILPGLGCDRDSPYEIWQFKLNVGDKVMVLVAVAVFDPITAMNPANHTQLLLMQDVFASRANEAPFMPPFGGCDRESYSGPVYWYNQGGSTVYNTDAMGMIVDGGPLKQEVSAHKDIGIPMNQDQTQMKFRINFCAPGLGPKN